MENQSRDKNDMNSLTERMQESSIKTEGKGIPMVGVSKLPNGASDKKTQPVCLIIVGMAGVGKTNFVKRLNAHLNAKSKKHLVVNLDPAVNKLPCATYIDIRDTVDYKEEMRQYNLGPNGGIVTCLNIFTTTFGQVMKCLEKKANDVEYIIFDTPGQIEVFNSSAAGPIIAATLASVYPTIIVYVIDIDRSRKPDTFVANMLYATSILYKNRMPLVMAMNKIDIISCEYAVEWMTNFESFNDAYAAEERKSGINLTLTLSLFLMEFYKNINSCGVSALTGEGFDEFLEKISVATEEYEDYRSDFEKCAASQQFKAQQDHLQANFKAMDADMDPDEQITIRRDLRPETEYFAAQFAESSEDEEDAEEKKELELLQLFKPNDILMHRTKEERKRQHRENN